MENYPKKPKARRKRINFRISEHEDDAIFHGYYQSGHEGTCSAYCRDILLGNRIHPNFEDQLMPHGFTPTTSGKSTNFSNVGPLDGHEEIQSHISAMVLAAHMLELKSSPTYQKILADNGEEFEAMVNNIRGYKYDDDTGMKSPLPGHKVQE